MKKTIATVALCCAAMGVQAGDDDIKQRVNESKGVIKEFFGQLKGELQAAMKAGGPLQAIEVCSQKAPGIAQAMSEQTGWEVGRTSLKYRNPANAPDAWEQAVLEKFEERKANGEAVADIAYFEVVEEDGQQSFRMMKAIPTGEVCLKCHGAELAPEVAAKLDELYPEDRARGFQLGDIRGAFTITQPM